MKTLLIGVALVGMVVLVESPVMAQQPGSLATVVSRGTIPGNGDANEDGLVTSVDALVVAQMVKLGKTGAGKSLTVRGYQQGDANLNGRLDKDDANLILKKVVGLATLPQKRFKPGDVNGDGYITGGDVIVLSGYLQVAWPGGMMIYNADFNQDYFVDERDLDALIACLNAGTCR